MSALCPTVQYSPTCSMPSRATPMSQSYIIELKYLPSKATDREAKTAKEQAVEQLNKYIADTNIQSLTAGTQLHGIYLIFQQGNATEIGEI